MNIVTQKYSSKNQCQNLENPNETIKTRDKNLYRTDHRTQHTDEALSKDENGRFRQPIL